MKAQINQQLKEAGYEGSDQFTSGLENGMEIQSPSKRAAREIGLPVAQGVGVGFLKGMAAFGKDGADSTLASLGAETLDFASKQIKVINGIDKKELINLVEMARSTVRASMQDPFGGARPEIIGGYYGNGGNTTSYTNTYNFNSPKALDYREMRQELRRMDQLNRLMALA